MSTWKKLSLFAGVALLGLCVIVPTSEADISNQATEITFNQPVRVPGQVLPAGTYWFTVVDANAGLTNDVQIHNANYTKLVSQFLTSITDPNGGFGQEVNRYGVRWPTGKMVLTFAESRGRHPAALLDWYYPGRTDGHRLIYSSKTQKQLDEEVHKTVAVTPGTSVAIGRSPAAFE